MRRIDTILLAGFAQDFDANRAPGHNVSALQGHFITVGRRGRHTAAFKDPGRPRPADPAYGKIDGIDPVGVCDRPCGSRVVRSGDIRLLSSDQCSAWIFESAGHDLPDFGHGEGNRAVAADVTAPAEAFVVIAIEDCAGNKACHSVGRFKIPVYGMQKVRSSQFKVKKGLADRSHAI